MIRTFVTSACICAFLPAAFGQPISPRAESLSKSTPSDLLIEAGELFPAPLAKQVQELIGRDLQRALSDQIKTNGDRDQSLATLYLADAFYRKLGVGRFESAPKVIWNGYDPRSNRPTFLYEKSLFAYVTSSGRRISPGTMETDGGSIPKLLHSVGSFTPWGYGPAYIVHDWLFVAHKCGNAPDSDFTFDQAATLLAEAIKTLMDRGFLDYDQKIQTFPKKEDTLYLIYQAVRSDIARSFWEQTNSVTCRKNP